MNVLADRQNRMCSVIRPQAEEKHQTANDDQDALSNDEGGNALKTAQVGGRCNYFRK